jgi:hypothetical protein
MLTFQEKLERLENGTRTQKAAAIGIRYGGFEGDHHRAWTIDQMLRVLCGADYPDLIRAYEQGGEYEWDTGIAP